MRDCDTSDSPLASYRPDIAGETDGLRDYLRERFAESAFGRNHASRQLAFELIDRAIHDAGGEAVDRAAGPSAHSSANETTIKLLRLLSRADEGGLGMRATCFLRLLGEDGRSFQAIADDFGFGSRAAPHAAYRQLQKQTGLRARGDKSDASREACRQRRLGARRERQEWQGARAWAKARANVELVAA